MFLTGMANTFYIQSSEASVTAFWAVGQLVRASLIDGQKRDGQVGANLMQGARQG